MKYLVDTNVLCELAKKHQDPQVVEWFSLPENNDLLISTITVGEIAYGIEKKAESKAKSQLANWLNSVLLKWFEDSIVSLDTETMLTWAKLRATGRTLPIIDSLIAASALTNNAALVTRNTKDFEGIEGLAVINPFIEQK